MAARDHGGGAMITPAGERRAAADNKSDGRIEREETCKRR
jgi:hypothetical protein